jgi:RimJ/RimL family protein N-acetyltransferase
MTASATITTPRLVLRPVQPEDGPALYALINNWNVVRWLARAPWPYTVDDMTWFIDKTATPKAATPDPIFALLVDGRTPIGCAECAGRRPDATPDEGTDLGFWIGEPYWGKGYMSETVSALIARAFSQPDVTLLRSGVFKGNDRSLRLHERLGFERTGLRMASCRSRGADWPLITFRLTRDRFERS